MSKIPEKIDAPDVTLATQLPSEASIRKKFLALTGLGVLFKYDAEIYRGVLKSLLKREQPSFPGLPARFAADSAAHAEDFMNFDVETHGEFPEIQEGERGIILSNHPNDPYFWSWCDVAAKNFSPDLRPIGKKGMLYDPRMLPPILGWPAYLGNMMIPINRKNRESAVSDIRKGCDKILRPGNSLFIFPDGHRPTEKRLAESRERMAEKYPDLDETMPYTCFPKSGGLMTALSATMKHPVRILNMTAGSNVPPQGDPYGSTFHVHGEEVKRSTLLGPNLDSEKQEAHLREWLVEEWKRKNQMIAEWVQS